MDHSAPPASPIQSSTPPIRVLTDRTGCVIDVDGDAPTTLNISARGLSGRRLHLFFPHDRAHLLAQMALANQGTEVRIETLVQPREKKARPAVITLRPCETDDRAELEWLIALRD